MSRAMIVAISEASRGADRPADRLHATLSLATPVDKPKTNAFRRDIARFQLAAALDLCNVRVTHADK